MSQTAVPGDDFRARILADPDVILSDHAVMKALIAANDAAQGANVIDLRGIAMARLEARLGRLETTHRSVIAAAYENLAGTNTIHRAVLRLLEPDHFAGFLRALSGEVAAILQVESVKLVLETHQTRADPVLARLAEVVVTAEPGFIDGYLSTLAAPAARPAPRLPGTGDAGPAAPAAGAAPAAAAGRLSGAVSGAVSGPGARNPPDSRPAPADSPAVGGPGHDPQPGRRITLRVLGPGEGRIHGGKAALIRSEACLRLDLGQGRLPGMLVLGAADAQQFRPTHGTDLLAFLTDVFERVMRRWLG